jgi:putative membrane protein
LSPVLDNAKMIAQDIVGGHRMRILTVVLLWLHLWGVAMGVGLGVAMSRIVPKVIAAPASERAQLWPLEKFLARVIAAGVVVLLITGPLMLWLKFNGGTGLGWPFWVKMVFVAALVICVGLSHWAAARLERGDESAAKLMSVSGPLTGISALLAMLFAVITFN